MRALRIRQPYVEEIFRGIKTMELRPKRCWIFNERLYIYAAQKPASRSHDGTFALTVLPLPPGEAV